jgi:hypothetical protein
MCLTSIDHYGKIPLPQAVIAEKFMRRCSQECGIDYFQLEVRYFHKNDRFRVGQSWGIPDYEPHGMGYALGVHAWPLGTPNTGANVLVLLRGPICAGWQDGHPVIVYREATILGKKEELP